MLQQSIDPAVLSTVVQRITNLPADEPPVAPSNVPVNAPPQAPSPVPFNTPANAPADMPVTAPALAVPGPSSIADVSSADILSDPIPSTSQLKHELEPVQEFSSDGSAYNVLMAALETQNMAEDTIENDATDDSSDECIFLDETIPVPILEQLTVNELTKRNDDLVSGNIAYNNSVFLHLFSFFSA